MKSFANWMVKDWKYCGLNTLSILMTMEQDEEAPTEDSRPPNITVTCISLIISVFAVTFTDSPFSGRSPLLPCSHTAHFYIHRHLSHAHMPPDSCAAEVCGGREQTVRRPSHGRSTAVAHFSFAQNGRHHRYRRVSGYAYTDGRLPKKRTSHVSR
ncbi:MAG: hypothetical protein IJ155_09270 [Prevotella sp.]|nr:hypothetical protein [Prevotella sp.]